MRILRKYTNRRLYDTSRSCYITLEDVKQLVLDNVQFQVQDSKSGQDLTRNILLQIISEQEGEGAGLLTNQVLQQLIRFYGDSMQGMMGQYLEQSVTAFLSQQERIREQMESMIDAANPLKMMGKFADRNMAVWGMFGQERKEEGAEEGNGADVSKEKGGAAVDADSKPDSGKAKK